MSDAAMDERINSAFLPSRKPQPFNQNERRLLNLVRHEGPISRAELARRTGLAMQSVVRLVEGLMERGFLRGDGRVISGRGQPSLSIVLVKDAAFTVGVSIMTDAMSVVLMDLSGAAVASANEILDISDRGAAVAHLSDTIRRLTFEAKIDPRRIFGVGVATTGYFIDAKRINPPASMDDWALRDLEVDLANALSLPVWLENDGNAAAVGESLFGVGRDHRSFAYVYIAGGLGGGLIVDGAPLRGFLGNAGEFTGLLPIDVRPTRPTLSLLLDMLRQDGLEFGGIGEMVARFDPNWPAVEAWLEKTAPAMSAIVSAIGAVVDPEAIVIGGRIPGALAARLVENTAYYAATLRDFERPFPRLLCARAKGDAAALGAASIPLKEHVFG
jgi:predicted NBD/HSP70 family sugar kinase